MPSRFAVLLLNMGGPATLDDVEGYIARFLGDREAIAMPGGWLYQKPLARLIAWRRAPSVKARYARIGGGSPIAEETASIARRLAERLGCEVRYAMRYTAPSLEDAARAFATSAPGPVVAVPLFPQYSFATTRSALAQLRAHRALAPLCRVVESHHLHPLYIGALAGQLREALRNADRGAATQVLFTAHSIPEPYTARGDPYVQQMRETVAAVVAAAGLDVPHTLAFQSAVGPMRWHGPSLTEALAGFIDRGVRELIVQPVSFVTENLETRYDLDVEFRERCLHGGIPRFIRLRAVGAEDGYIDALAALVGETLI